MSGLISVSRWARQADHSGRAAGRVWRRVVYPAIAAGMLFAMGLLLAVTTAGDYGVAWDDRVQTRYGHLVLDYFLTAGQDRSCNAFLDLCFYGPPVELGAAVLARLQPERGMERRHLLTALIALLSIPALYRWGRVLGNRWVGLLAALLLLACPRFYGHAFVNAKDIPFAVGMIASLAALASLFALRRYRWREYLHCGLLIGCTVAVRPGGWLILGPMYVLAAIHADWTSRRGHRQSAATVNRGQRRPLGPQVTMLLTAWLVMIICWPWAHQSPISHPLQAIRMSSQFHITVPVLFDGRMWMSDALPRSYLVHYLVVTTPLITLVFAIVGALVAAARFVRAPHRPRSAVLAMLLVWTFLPLGMFFVLRPNTYDGLRHFLFLLPALALLAALGMETMYRHLDTRLARRCFLAAMLAAVAPTLLSLVTLHPYQMAYYNMLVGGPAGTSGHYDTEYWMTSYREAIEWIRRQPRAESAKPLHVLVAANEHSRWCAEYCAGPELVITTTLSANQLGDLPAHCDYYIGTTRSRMADNFPAARVVKRMERAGATFTVVKSRRGAAGADSGAAKCRDLRASGVTDESRTADKAR